MSNYFCSPLYVKNGVTHLVLKNKAGKIWLLNREKMDFSLVLFQPFTFKGKIVKLSLKIFPKVTSSRLFFPNVSVEIPDEFSDIMQTYYGKNIWCSFFMGTPGPHQKLTVQVNSSSKILGYIKVTNDNRVAQILENERIAINYLDKFQISSVPEFRGVETFQGWTCYLYRTERKKNSKITTKFVQKHETLLDEIFQKTKLKTDYSKTSFYSDMENLRNNINSTFLGFLNKDLILEQISEIENRLLKNESFFSFYHGDFTPWNSFIQDGQLHVFDFEYSRMLYPPFLDIFHYYTQVFIHLRKYSASRILKYFLKNMKLFSKYFEDPVESYKMYILSALNWYLSRSENFSEEEIRVLSIWQDLLLYLTQVTTHKDLVYLIPFLK